MNWLRQPIEYWGGGGPLLFPIALVSVGIWAYFLRARARLAGVAREGKCIAAGEDASGPVATLVKTTMRDAAPDGTAELFEARGERMLAQLGKDLVVLGALTAVAPLLGLLGTVTGMIDTFEAVSAGDSGTAEQVASGVSQALITTQFGLVVAIPGVFGLVRLQRLLDHIRIHFDTIRVHLLQVAR